MNRKKELAFVSDNLRKSFLELKKGKFEDKQLYNFLNRAFEDLKENPFCGTRIQKKLWPKEYKKYLITNLMKYNLPNSWRIIYTIKQDEISILSLVLEWMNHKDYERRFNY